jgi:hypothetical protein
LPRARSNCGVLVAAPAGRGQATAVGSPMMGSSLKGCFQRARWTAHSSAPAGSRRRGGRSPLVGKDADDFGVALDPAVETLDLSSSDRRRWVDGVVSKTKTSDLASSSSAASLESVGRNWSAAFPALPRAGGLGVVLGDCDGDQRGESARSLAVALWKARYACCLLPPGCTQSWGTLVNFDRRPHRQPGRAAGIH